MTTKAEAAREILARRKARNDFYSFRLYMHPEIKRGWWQKEVARQLMLFYLDIIACLSPKLIIQAPPQHGKSVQIIDFIAWIAGKHPNMKAIYTSFSERLGIRANLTLQRMYDSKKYKAVFPGTTTGGKNSVSISSQNLRNRAILEYVGHEGFFRNTTVCGSITGESLDLGIIDDPIRGRKDANSITIRNSVWDWFTDDFFTRFSEEGALLAILTRWHVDDPIGRLLKIDDSVKALSYPALAISDEKHRKEGEPLFPEHKSREFLLKRKKIMPAPNFEALYQQNPYVKGGEMFKLAWWKYWTVLPPMQTVRIYGDTAQKTSEQNDYTVFQCWGRSFDGLLYLIDQLRGKVEAPELLVQARSFYNKHNKGQCPVSAFKVEDKVSGTGLIQTLRREGIPIVGIQRNIDKVTRGWDATPTVEAGICHLPREAWWLSEYQDEITAFPNYPHDDQADPTFDAIIDLGAGNNIDYGAIA